MTTANVPRRVLLVDRFPVFRLGLRRLVETTGRYQVVGEADTAPEALRLADLHAPDLVVLGLELAGVTGLTLTRALRERAPAARPICLAARLDDDCIFAAAEVGVAACLPRGGAPEALLDVLHRVTRGERPIDRLVLSRPAVAARVLAAVRAQGAAVHARHTGGGVGAAGPIVLSAREVEVLDGLARGLSNRGIAAELFLREQTVKGYVSSLMRKLGADDRLQTFLQAVRTGWVEVAA